MTVLERGLEGEELARRPHLAEALLLGAEDELPAPPEALRGHLDPRSRRRLLRPDALQHKFPGDRPCQTAAVREILPGVHHWTTVHARWGITIHSYWLAAERVLIDPRVPVEGLEWFEGQPPVAILLTNRHHYRDSGAYHERFGCPVLCNRLGLHEFRHGEPVEGFDPGDELPGGVVALEVGGICPDETALHATAHRAVAIADGLVRFPDDGPLRFVVDALMDDPDRTKAELRAAYRRIAEIDFDALLLAHGDPIVSGGREALRDFAGAA